MSRVVTEAHPASCIYGFDLSRFDTLAACRIDTQGEVSPGSAEINITRQAKSLASRFDACLSFRLL